MLSQEHVHELYDAAVSAGLSGARATLLAGIDPRVIAMLPAATSAGAELLGVLHALNGMGQVDDGSAPLEAWLGNAELLAGPREQAAVFRRALERLAGQERSRAALHEGPGGVPATAVPHFLGRADEMRDLRDALAAGSAVCVVATGLGGVGKTSLVRQFVATEAVPMFPDGSVWIDAMNLDSDAVRVCARFNYESERRPTPTEAARFLARVLHDKRVLVVVDNVSDKIDISSLPVVGGRSRTVLTSRLLALHASVGHQAHQLLLGRWSEETCRAYLRKVVPALVSAPDEDLNGLVTYVGRLPLAVRLLARLLMRPGTTSGRLLDRLKQEPLGTLDKVAIGADRGVAATFQASHDVLDDAQRRVLLALAACARVTDAAMVARIAAVTSPIADEALADLAERSLVECVDAERGLWTMHDVVRLFVRAQPETRQADEAHLAFATEHVEAHQDPLDWQAMEAGMAEVLAAVDRLLDTGDAQRAWQLVRPARVYLMQRGRYRELIERFEQLAARLLEGSEVLAIVLGNVGLCYEKLGDIPRALEHHQRALALDQKFGRLQRQAVHLGNLGNCYEKLGATPKAIEHHQRALALDEQLGVLQGQARHLGNLGICYRSRGDIPKALEYHQRALALDEQLGMLQGQAANLANLGTCYRSQGDLPKALEHHQRALDLEEKLGRLEGQADNIANLGTCCWEQGNIPKAFEHYQRALAIYEKLGLVEHQAIQLVNLGVCYQRQGDFSRAIEHHKRSLAIEGKLGRLKGQAVGLGNLGSCYGEQGDLPEAIEHHQRALDLDEQLGVLEGQATHLGNLGITYRSQGDLPKAIEHYQRALAIEEKLGRLDRQANNLGDLGGCYWLQADIPHAFGCYKRALALWRRVGLPDHHPNVRAILDALARFSI